MLNSKSPNTTNKSQKNKTKTTLFENTGELTKTIANKTTSTNHKLTTTGRTNESKNYTVRTDPLQSTFKQNIN